LYEYVGDSFVTLTLSSPDLLLPKFYQTLAARMTFRINRITCLRKLAGVALCQKCTGHTDWWSGVGYFIWGYLGFIWVNLSFDDPDDDNGGADVNASKTVCSIKTVAFF